MYCCVGVSTRSPPDIAAVPLSVHLPWLGGGKLFGSGEVPSPDNVTVCTPAPSSPVRMYEPACTPVEVGVNVTDWWITSPGASVSPSEICVLAKSPTGAFAFVIVNGRLPSLRTSNVAVRAWPCGTWPKSSDVGEIVIFGAPVTADPDNATLTGPSALVTVRVAAKVPAVVGANVTDAVTEPPAGIVAPGAGRPLTVNGSPGRVAPVIVVAAVPVLTMFTDSALEPPVESRSNASDGGSAPRPACVPMPRRSIEASPVSVVNVSETSVATGAVGV